MPIALKLVPNLAAESIAVRIATIASCEKYIRETVARYEGLKIFEAELAKLGVSEAVQAVLKRS